MTKTLKKLGVGGVYCNIIKAIYNKPAVILNEAKQMISLRSTVLEVLPTAIMKEK